MTLASDQNLDPDKLSPISRKMLELRDAVFSEWERRVRSSVKGAGTLSHPILINTLPTLYDNLAEALSPDYPRTSAATATPSVALEHGGERARVTHYEAPAVICEYQILRSTIIDVLRQHQVPISDDEMHIIGSSIDASIREAVTAFTLAQSAFREQFIATLAHDLRSPLAAASTSAQLILRIRDFEKIDGVAQRIINNLGRIDQMIQDLLDTVMFQQGERLSLHPTNFDIAEVVAEVCEQASTVHGPRFETAGTSIKGWWGRDAIKRALENLISNAVKYGAPDTPIRIMFKEYHERMLLSVHNQGNPIPPDQVETVFQAFRRAKAAKAGDQQGWGIGLPYVRSVAESHGGSIDVDSAEERGTTFAIDIPVDSRPFQNSPTL
ncbi:HAMP domain-containing sensor histidine kinase [Noviherbaspirillum sp.]|uniref:sensor histidine kinase n=1 Tax=Noviherbaspirillum sp. TaxID=1926288 RepID=UPI002D386187|nr:HAMP domain-containing sensor histidine kinase [Noviherbaspirillum sp.]HZW20177.1 HAMP domain-containing sensor histidine kinase [Noviherbaspirillum sp.]